MKKTLLTLTCILFVFSYSFSQDIHSPKELLEIMEDSEITYELAVLEEEVEAPDRSDNLNYNHYYRVMEDGELVTYEYETGEKENELMDEAEMLFRDGKLEEARKKYMEILDVNPNYYQVMTYIGQTYGLEKDFDNAIDWYEKTIERNYIDYMAHWFLADAYMEQGEKEKALEEIVIAQILNRNNPRIQASLKKIFKENKLKTTEWSFTPQIQIDSTGYKQISVGFSDAWIGYALAKSIWMYEPGYREEMGEDGKFFSILEEKECIASLFVILKKKQIRKNPEFKAIDLSLDNDMFEEYIIYEILLPNYPYVAYQFPKPLIDAIKDYVIEVRGSVK